MRTSRLVARWLLLSTLAGCPGAAPPSAPPPPAAPAPAPPPRDPPAPARKDVYGDPLPAGARARLGTARFAAGLTRRLTVSRDGKLIATSEPRVWDARTGAPVLDLVGLDRGTDCVALSFSDDGTRLCVSSSLKTFVWDVPGRKTIFELDKGPSALSPDGKTLAVSLWSEGLELLTGDGFKDHVSIAFAGPDLVDKLAFSPDGRYVACAGESLVLVDVAKRKDLWRWTPPQGGREERCRAVAFSPDGSRVAFGGKTVLVRACLDGNEAFAATPDESLETIAFSPDGKRIAAGGTTLATILDAATGEKSRTIPDVSHAVGFLPDGTLVTYSGCLRFRDVGTGTEKPAYERQEGEVRGLALSKERVVVVASRRWLAWDPASGKTTGGGRLAGDGWAFSVAGDGSRILEVVDDALGVIDPSSGQERLSTGLHAKGTAAALSPDGERVALVAGDAVSIRNSGTWAETSKFSCPGTPVVAVRFAGTRHVGTEPGFPPRACLLEPGKRTPLGRADHVAVSHDGATIAVADIVEGTIAIFDAATGEKRATIQGKASQFGGIALSPKGKLLAYTAEEGHNPVAEAVVLVDLARPAEAKKLRGHISLVCSLAFSTEGDTLASGGSDRTVVLWDVKE